MPKITDFGFEKIDELPIKKNDWEKLLEAFLADESATAMMKKFDLKIANNKAASIRKAADKLNVNVKVISRGDTVYVTK
nr:MAG: hypothetical protein [Bacteriophage sp.]